LLQLENRVEIAIRNIGNSKGVVLPKPLLAQVGLEGQATVHVAVENGAIVLRKPAKAVRAGWAEAAAVVNANGNDALLMGEFGNVGDAELSW
jgi:antitoxin MazE